METMKRPFVGYVRISKLNGRAKGDNLSAVEQQREIRRIGDTFGLKLMPETISDEDVSGLTFERPGWKKAISLIEQGKAGGIVAFDFKRISRGKTAEVLAMIEDVEALGGQLYDSSGPVSVDDADAELVATVKAMIARKEWRERKSYLDASVRNAIERGVHLNAPYGYRKVNGKGSRLVPVPDEAGQVRRVFEMRADGHTFGAIAEALNASGAPPRPYVRHGITKRAVWTHKTVRQLAEREVYLGTAWNGTHRHPGAHEAIVTPELYAKASRAKGVKALGPAGPGYMLSGLARCAGCGYVMIHHPGKGEHRYYRCVPYQHGAGNCPAQASVPAAELEAHVADRFKTDWLGSRWEAEPADATVTATGENVDRWKARLKAALQVKIDLGEQASEAEIEIADEHIAESRAGLRQAEDEHAQARAQVRGADLPAELDADLFDTLPVAEQRYWLSLVYAAVVVKKGVGYRHPAADRARLLPADDAPTDSTRLIPFVAALRW